ncbi:MAG: hypothetical protein AAFR00_12795, partial [Pseudomonadota bacterium]
AGVSRREEGWAVAALVAIGDENGGTVSRYGVGGEYDITTNIYVAADAVLLNTEDAFGNSDDGAVGLVEVGLRF